MNIFELPFKISGFATAFDIWMLDNLTNCADCRNSIIKPLISLMFNVSTHCLYPVEPDVPVSPDQPRSLRRLHRPTAPDWTLLGRRKSVWPAPASENLRSWTGVPLELSTRWNDVSDEHEYDPQSLPATCYRPSIRQSDSVLATVEYQLGWRDDRLHSENLHKWLPQLDPFVSKLGILYLFNVCWFCLRSLRT